MSGSLSWYVDVSFVFGIEGVDRSDFNKYIPHVNRGNPVYDGSFDISSAVAQAGIKTACQSIRDYACTVEGCDSTKGLGKLIYTGSLKCYQEDFETWYRGIHGAGAAIPTGTAFITQLIYFR